MGSQFTVVTDALLDACDGVTQVVDVVSKHDLTTIDPSNEHLGDSDLHSALTSFTERWAVALKQLVGDGTETAERLRATASVYLGADEESLSLFRQMLGE